MNWRPGDPHESGSANSERLQPPAEWQGDRTEYPKQSIHALFAKIARELPHAIAVESQTRQLTYRQLDDRANQLARLLQKSGVIRETRVGIYLDRSSDMITAILGILKAGGAYVPLDRDYPRERIQWMLEDSQASVVITSETTASQLDFSGVQVISLDSTQDQIDQFSSEELSDSGTSRDLAYLMYTSGSTGKPKGTAIEHRSVVRLVRNTNYADFGPQHVYLQFAPLSFDASTFEIWGPLLNGGKLVLSPPGLISFEELVDLVKRHQVTTVWLTAGLFHQLSAEHFQGLSGLQQLLTGGDIVNPDHAKLALRHMPRTRLINGYGPTENTTFTCCHTMHSADDVGKRVSIGKPISNTNVYVLDQQGNRCPIGSPGELHIGGDGLARGYWNRPELTATSFVPDPFSCDANARMYRTGDRVCWHPEGTLDFLGRLDDQVKIRGFRIEPREIESVLVQHASVESTVVNPHVAKSGEKQLVAYVVPSKRAMFSSSELRSYLSRRLPNYMIPSFFVRMESFPLNANGKVERRLLPAPQADAHSVATPAKSSAESSFVEIWQEVLDIQGLGVGDDLSELGANSLKYMQVATRIRQRLGARVRLRDLFGAKTIAEQLAMVEQNGNSESISISPDGHPNGPARHQLSSGQLSQWYLHRFQGAGNRCYNILLSYSIHGPLDADILEHCLGVIVGRHDILRTVYHDDDSTGSPRCEIRPVGDFSLQRLDLGRVVQSERQTQIERQAVDLAGPPFDLTCELPLRAQLLRLSQVDHILILVIHHIAFDAWSEGVLFRELRHLYRACAVGEATRLADLSLQYSDFAAFQNALLNSPWAVELTQFWKAELKDAPSTPILVADYPVPKRRNYSGRTIVRRIDSETRLRLKELGEQSNATLFVTLLAAFNALLFRYTKREDLVLGTALANRTREEFESLIGFFVNTVAIRTDLSRNPTFRILLQRVRDRILAALEHQELPIDRVVAEVAAKRDASLSPLYQIMFLLQSATEQDLSIGDLDIRRVTMSTRTAKMDLIVTAFDDADGLDVVFEYSDEIFDGSRIGQMADAFVRMIDRVVRDPDRPLAELPSASLDDPGLAIDDDERSPGAARALTVSEKTLAGKDLQKSLQEIWMDLLGNQDITIHDSFFEVGGHSLLLLALASRIERSFSKKIPIANLVEANTIAKQAKLIAADNIVEKVAAVVPLIDSDQQRQILLMPSIGGNPFSHRSLIASLSQHADVFGIQLRTTHDSNAHYSMQELARYCVKAILESQLVPPFRIAGYSFGGMLGYEVGCQLRLLGYAVDFLGVIDAGPPATRKQALYRDRFELLVGFIKNAPRWMIYRLAHFNLSRDSKRVVKKLRGIARRGTQIFRPRASKQAIEVEDIWEVKSMRPDDLERWRAHLKAFLSYAPSDYAGQVDLYRARVRPLFHSLSTNLGWSSLELGNLVVHDVPGDHDTMLREPNCAILATQIVSAMKCSAATSLDD